MRKIQLRSTTSTLYEGYYPNTSACLESALQQGITLEGLILCGENLSNINADDAALTDVTFKNCNLTGANLSESTLSHVQFISCTLVNACFAYSTLTSTDFINCLCGATDMTQASAKTCTFTGTSCFSIHFSALKSIQECTFRKPNTHVFTTSYAPIIIQGIEAHPLIFKDLDDLKAFLKIGNKYNFS